MRQLALRYGANVRPSVGGAPRVHASLLSIVLENAVEGCVRESFGALIAHTQAALARDTDIALTLHCIAADETRHAEPAWQVASWIEPQLSAAERACVDRARALALRELSRDVEATTLPELARGLLGLPDAGVMHTLLQRMALELALS